MLLLAIPLVLAGACAEGASLDEDETNGPRRSESDASSGGSDARARSDASGGSSGVRDPSSSSGEISSSSGGEIDASVEAGPTSPPASRR